MSIRLARYRKAVAAFIGGAVSLAALFAPGVEQIASPAMVSALANAVAVILVYAIPNEA